MKKIIKILEEQIKTEEAMKGSLGYPNDQDKVIHELRCAIDHVEEAIRIGDGDET